MKKTILILTLFAIVSCGNNVETKVPEKIEVQTAPVTGEIVIKHIMQIELPTIFTDTCKKQHPNDEAAYQDCVAKYIEQLIKIIGSINPGQLPVIP